MDVVTGPAGGENLEPEIVRDAKEVSVKRLLQFSRDEVAALLRAEDAMQEIGGMGVGHGSAVP